MASPPIPPSLDRLAARPFSFYPPIVNVEHNEWLFRKATWSEIQVVNCRSGEEIWISRRFVGEVSRIDEPVLIVGLGRELELKSGLIVPVQRRIIEMPLAVGAPVVARASSVERNGPAPVVGIRLEPPDRRALKSIPIAVSALVVLSLAAIGLTRVGALRQKNITLDGRDDFFAVTGKLGPPTSDRSRETGGLFYRALAYPERRYTVILMGADQGSMTYIGAMDQNWRPIRSVNAHSDSLLRTLQRF